MLDRQLNVQDISAAWRGRISSPVDQQSQPSLSALFKPQTLPALEQALNRLLTEDRPIKDLSGELNNKAGFTPALVSAWSLTSAPSTASGDEYCILLIASDVTPISNDWAELSQLRVQYQSILDCAGEGIYGLDQNGKISFGNKAATQILGWEIEQVIGKSSHDVHHHSHQDGRHYPQQDCPIYAALQDGEIHRVDNEVFWHTNGKAVPVEYVSTPIIVDGKPNGAVIIFRDDTRRRQLESQREDAFEEILRLKEKLELERDYLRDEVNLAGNYGEIIGDSQALKRTLSQVEAVAQTPASVLILGESGVGKEMIARAIHMQSDRADKAMIKVNCASIPNELFESEFFGHVRGAFTGAHQDRIGRLQLADGGTLFLDEVGEIPLSQQGKLLRALQENEFERVGDHKTQQVNVRVVAATNRNLAEEVKAGRFREDLYYRLSVFPIEVPPLRDRRDDIAPLAISFLAKACTELKREKLKLSKSHMAVLKQHDWPGNIRELKNTIDRAVISSSGNKLRLDLALDGSQLRDPNSTASNVTNPITTSNTTSDSFVSSAEFKAMEKANIIAALEAANWKTWGDSGAAALLGIKASTLAYQIKTFGIIKPTA
ncbi:MAG: Fis family transcriptional regulator [SAR86 cluster bacterium]|uniref:Fis family transcriptional regulator n=1 Tax=SAR86 cluster bacterium TaxID=2030880 RepID=A0A2A4MPY3_9GAMM|nr:MAG: Fis family transcriptional regulator [SAR86 cluster bacterium]